MSVAMLDSQKGIYRAECSEMNPPPSSPHNLLKAQVVTLLQLGSFEPSLRYMHFTAGNRKVRVRVFVMTGQAIAHEGKDVGEKRV